MKRLNVLQSLAVLFVFSQIAWGAVPQLINFQGILRDGSGNPVVDGSYSVTFTIYDAPSAGNVIWTETQSVTTTDGLFTILLGNSTPVLDSIFNDSSRWLGIQVGADPEMTPRQRLSSVGFSHRSSEWASDGQNLFRSSGNVGIGTTSPAERLDVDGNIAIRNSNSLKIFSDGVGLNFTNAPGAFGTLDMQKTGDLNPSVRLGHSNFPARAFTIMTGDGTGGATERITVLPSGNVGIGTASPTAKLHIGGTPGVDGIRYPDGTLQTTAAAGGGGSPGGGNGAVQFNSSGLFAGDSTNLHWDDSTKTFRINTSGFDNGLVVAKNDAATTLPSVGATAAIRNDNATDNNFSILGFQTRTTGGAAGGVVRIGAQFTSHSNSGMTGDFIVETQNAGVASEKLRVKSDGNVGIGTAAPDYLVHARRNQNAGTSLMVENQTSGSFAHATYAAMNNNGLWTTWGMLSSGYVPSGVLQADGGYLHSNGPGGLGIYTAHASGTLRLATNSTERMRIDVSGNVGIGTASPGASNLLELSSTTKGFVLPRMTKTERDAIASPVAGMMVYQTDNTPGLRVYNGTNWMRFTETAD